MFDVAEIGSTLAKEDYKARMPDLRARLLEAQFHLRRKDVPVLIAVAGDDRIGCEELIDRLNEWLDARYLDTQVFEEETEEERQRPRFWRYWMALPPRGRAAIFFGGLALDAIADRYLGRIDSDGFAARMEHVRTFERAIVADGMLLVKIWLHLPRQELRRRLKRKDSGWQLEQRDWIIFKHYDEIKPLCERYLQETSAGGAAWTVVESTDARHRDLRAAEHLLAAFTARLDEADAAPATRTAEALKPAARPVDVLGSLDLSRRIAEEDYRDRLEDQQRRLHKLSLRARREGLSSVLAFEGWDSAGKGGAIRRLVWSMKAANCRVVPVAAPTDEERARHYLWRFWRHLPHAGKMLIFDRSWYGRVLVERVEGFARPEEWRRAYDEINDFERQLTDHGSLLLKFWLHIDKDEQLRRFEERANTPRKRYKITEEDYRNRERWDDYLMAVNEMVARTGSTGAPWVLVPANDKRAARIQVLTAVCDGLDRLL
ncbi:polyphosphate:AMP phosphotransferase (plasmid) [Skermanella sp. TT6]|uniref:Polyphosphate:AMP phosphotransferase n=1 Tax=Skermanella cutis TaxID=2775420 RepID=A0ABX7BH54_9PROT|nr:polyphosphate:AMP phosphotransferase [Skermanella sp. TT6]QQP92925.1 polyphosphate:AMP phosphotransferase [Skermanella sp. TT6]